MKKTDSDKSYVGVMIALDPSPSQIQMLHSHCGASRFCYNWCIDHVKGQLERKEKPRYSQAALRKDFNAEKDEVAPWWEKNSKECYSTGCEAASSAFKNFFDSKKGKRKGPPVGFPKYKSRNKGDMSFAYTTGSFGPDPNDPKRLRCPRIGHIHTFENVDERMKKAGAGRVTRMTVSFRHGRWYASLTCEKLVHFKENAENRKEYVGVDLGIKSLAVLSDPCVSEPAFAMEDGVVASLRPLKKKQKKLARAQRKLARQQKGSKRREKQKRKIGKIHASIYHERQNQLHQLTTWLVSHYSHIGIEDLNVSGMLKNHKLALAISDCGFYEFKRMLSYKAIDHGTVIHYADRFYPSSKRCSHCGNIKKTLTLKDRTYICEKCGVVLDRDYNAAINLESICV